MSNVEVRPRGIMKGPGEAKRQETLLSLVPSHSLRHYEYVCTFPVSVSVSGPLASLFAACADG